MTSRRVTIVATELLGRPGTGGAGTADSLLAVALGRHGHEVQLLIASGREIGPPSDDWQRVYESAGVRLRMLEALPGVRPSYLAPPFEVFQALREERPDVVVANDWRGLAYAALRARSVGLDLHDTAFVIHCHSPTRVLAEFARKVPDRVARFGQEVAERASIALADAVVSPSEWLLGWLRTHDWPMPDDATVIQYVRESVALDREPTRAEASDRVRRLAFFGQLREGKGVRLFLSALSELESELDGIEVVFLGSDTARWPAEVIAQAVPARAAAVDVQTGLYRDAALDELRKRGTLAVIPSLLDNSPNTVSECIEHGVPFIATHVGGIPELVAEEDRARVLCAASAGDLAAALRHALRDGGFAPARPAREPSSSLDAWLELIQSVSPRVRPGVRSATNVAVVTSSETAQLRAQELARQTQTAEVEVIHATSRHAGLARSAADWVVFLDEEDIPDPIFLDRLVAAQAATNADVVTTAVRLEHEAGDLQLFLGEPGSLGLIENQYGVVGLVRSELAAAQPLVDGGVDPDWALFARLALAETKIVSIPEPLASHRGSPGQVTDVPGEGLMVLDAFEEQHVAMRDLPQLAATLGAANARLASARESSAPQPAAAFLRRLVRAAGRSRGT